LRRWKNQGTWIAAYDEWQEILESDSDGALLGSDVGSRRGIESTTAKGESSG